MPSDVGDSPFTDSTQNTVNSPGATGAGSHATNTVLAISHFIYGSSYGALFGPPSQNIFNSAWFYQDGDNVTRRAMGGLAGFVTPPTYSYGTSHSSDTAIGLPMLTRNGNITNIFNRPIMLHRPYRSVAELGYAFSDTPWRNIDFFTSESGYSALLDVFCINEDHRPDALRAGQVDLNGRQAPVFQALLAGAYQDEFYNSPSTNAYWALSPMTGSATQASTAAKVAQALVARTTSIANNEGPLTNIGDLVGRYVANYTNANGQPYAGFSDDLTNILGAGSTLSIIQRLREASVRALSDAGQAGTWNLLIDVVAQSGRYPTNATTLSDFLVEGQRHYWVHVAIDRQTGQVIDENTEVVNE